MGSARNDRGCDTSFSSLLPIDCRSAYGPSSVRLGCWLDERATPASDTSCRSRCSVRTSVMSQTKPFLPPPLKYERTEEIGERKLRRERPQLGQCASGSQCRRTHEFSHGNGSYVTFDALAAVPMSLKSCRGRLDMLGGGQLNGSTRRAARVLRSTAPCNGSRV